ncbi:MAG: MBL fold metallo-hydrolase [Candidatus Thermoplasmatota archaeon]|nr:MBL fold metallo-hydrolase [Candidatus Thermoplasmatota archaeon]
MTDITVIEAGPFDSNIFLLMTKESAVLIDTGSGFHNRTVIHNIEKRLDGSKLDGIVLTHEHFDHSGGARNLMEHFDVPLYSSNETARALREADENLTGSFLFGAHMEPVMDILEMGSELSIGDIEIEVYSTPGHSPGMVCLITREDRELFCGDLLFCDGGVGRWDLPGGNLDLLKGSISASLKWNISSLYPGHGRVETRDPKGQIELSARMLSIL